LVHYFSPSQPQLDILLESYKFKIILEDKCNLITSFALAVGSATEIAQEKP
jgi:hypothetical protein